MSETDNAIPPGYLGLILAGKTGWQIVTDQFKRVHEEFRECAFKDEVPIGCELHNSFGTANTTNHNCLGCTFAESILLIDHFLGTHEMQTEISFAYQQLILVLYLLTARIETLFDIIELNRLYRDEHFRVLVLVRRWANFLKHPKAFLLTHHPTFLFEGHPMESGLRNDPSSIVIDRKFVDAYYANDEKNKDLLFKLENKEKVLVVFPDASQICKDVCAAMKGCVAVIAENKVYRDLLAKKATFNDYFTSLNGAPKA